MNKSRILEGKRAVVFGAGGSVGSAVAKEFAAEGADVYLSGRNKASVDEVKRAIESAGGKAYASVVDALDEDAVGWRRRRAVSTSSLMRWAQIRANLGGKPAMDVMIDEYMVALSTILKSRIITAKIAARQMIKHGSGVIIGITGSTVRGHIVGGTSIGLAFGAIETLMENLAFELGPKGVRVCLRMTANVDSNAIRNSAPAMVARDHGRRFRRVGNPSRRLQKVQVRQHGGDLLLRDVDRFRLLTGTVVNSSAGAAYD